MRNVLFVSEIVFIFFAASAFGQTFTEFKFTAGEIGWEQDFVGVIDNNNKTITFSTQKWIENIASLSATFAIDGGTDVTVNGSPQYGGLTSNDFRKPVVYAINNAVQYTVSFISPQATGIPVIRINTVGNAPINSKEIYTNIELVSLSDPNNTRHNFSRRMSDIALPDRPNDEIKGRGNATWAMPQWNLNYPKKPYRLRFNEKVSLFGLEAARNWILLAEYRDPSYIFTPLTFYVGKEIFEMPFTNSYFHVHLYLNGDYRGLYGLTEHKQVNPGRIDIDSKEGWHVNIDAYYDEDPKFKTDNYQLPIMIKSPEPSENGNDINNPAYQFVKDDWNELTNLMNAGNFPDNGYRELIDMSTFVNYLLVSDMIRNFEELEGPKSMQAYKDKGGKISLGPLWDFDCGFGYNYQSTHIYFTSYRDFILKHAFLQRFYDDPIFRSELRKSWDAKYQQVLNATEQIDAIAENIRRAVSEDAKRWYKSNNIGSNSQNNGYVGNQYDTNHVQVTNKLKEWWNQRAEWLNNEIKSQFYIVASPIIGKIASSNIQAYAINKQIILQNLPPNAKVEVYNLQGKQVYSATSPSPLATSLKIEVQTKGIYILKVRTKDFLPQQIIQIAVR